MVLEPEPSSLPTTSSTRRSKKVSAKKSEDVAMKNADGASKSNSLPSTEGELAENLSDEDDDGETGRAYDEDDEDGDDPFRGSFLGHGGPSAGISSTLRALSGMVSGLSARLREILVNLKQKEDPSVQLIALQELSEILLVSTEDNLSGHFSPEPFVKELVELMKPPSEEEEGNPEMMLLACRCVANLMEAMPPSTANVVYGGAVPVLCQKLLRIDFIDLAEQALSVSNVRTQIDLPIADICIDTGEDIRRVSIICRP
jgi:E3 ubiquitin-protein ligase TRIP12